MVDLKKPLDLNSVDAGALISNVLAQKVVVANILVLLAAAGGGYYIYTDYVKAKAQAEQNISDLKHKLDVIATYKTTKKEFGDYSSALPKSIEEDALVSALSDFAVQNGIEIVSFSPVTSADFPYYSLVSVDMSVRATGFKELVLFLRSIEKESKALRIESYHFGAFKDKKQEMTMHVSSVKVKTNP